MLNIYDILNACLQGFLFLIVYENIFGDLSIYTIFGSNLIYCYFKTSQALKFNFKNFIAQMCVHFFFIYIY